jgi:hypothetical protein
VSCGSRRGIERREKVTQEAIELTDLKKYRDDRRHQIILSVDLGYYQDYSAFTVSEVKPEAFRNLRGAHKEQMHIYVRDIQRLPLGTPYPEVRKVIHNIFWDRRLWLIDDPSGGHLVAPTLVVDEGGPGIGVIQDLRKDLGVGFYYYYLVRGTSESKKVAPWRYSIARTVAFQHLYAAFSNGRIHIDSKLKLASTLLEELRNLRPETNEETGYQKVVHREGEHDDLAICLAATNWWANRPRQRLRVVNDEATVRKLMGA